MLSICFQMFNKLVISLARGTLSKTNVNNQMKNVVPVSEITLEAADHDTPGSPSSARINSLWIELVSILLGGAALVAGLGFWQEWFSSIDRVICTVCVSIGLVVAFCRSNWRGELSNARLFFGIALFCVAAAIVGASYGLGRPRLTGIACGFILAAWCSLRVLGESVQHSLSLGMVFAIPSFVDAFADRGGFLWLESVSISVTGGLADAIDVSSVREGQKLLFATGVADRFSCVGAWDSVLSFFSIAICCVLCFRRNLVAGIITAVFSAITWIALRGAAWVMLVWLGETDGIWREWSTGLEVCLFLFGAILVVSVDQFFSALLEPIPLEFNNLDFQLFTFLWNWFCGLPKLTLSLPQRDDAFSREMEDDYDSN